MKVLVFGDTHMPTRRRSIPPEFFQHIAAINYDLALVTGDLVREEDMRKALPSLPRTVMVRGNMDYSSGPESFHREISLEVFNILLIHGTQLRPRGNIEQLWEIAENIGADITIHGHTHKAAIDLYKSKLFLNPGTLSGASSGSGGRIDASFMELDLKKKVVDVVLFNTNWKVMKRSSLSFVKEDGMKNRE
ncbi:YfcE family phosphodiesterase [Candidatus Thorarchaeota archaeon]|nr:MAG: YfcE family phosphodiesterase [Candidatus Thorarchaeota archaeon]